MRTVKSCRHCFSQAQLKEILTAAGAELVEQLPEPSQVSASGPGAGKRRAREKASRQFLVLSEEVPPSELLASCTLMRVVPVKVDWLLDSISFYSLRPIEEYAHAVS